ncbi:MAG: flagellar hook assembly protein FlgD [Dongiaceae bacterium]
MAVSPVSSSTPHTTTSRAALADNFDKFLFLLTTQLQNQDPLQPMDTAEFTNQLVQYANVEQAISTNQNLETLISLQSDTATINSLGFLGKSVEVLGDMINLADGQSRFAYTMENAASEVRINIRSEDGRTIVRTLTDNPTAAGRHEITWDGKDANGNDLPAGTYKIEVIASRNNGVATERVTTVTSFIGTVTGVNTALNNKALLFGNTPYTFDRIMRVGIAAN